LGAYHTIDLELNREFTVSKENWDTISLDRIHMACDPTQYADVAAVIMQEGIATNPTMFPISPQDLPTYV
jgi:protein pelota